MFEDMSIPGVYALSASNPTESSWGSYCGTEAKVNGKSINSCLGDLFSVSWMEDADAQDTTKESLEQAFTTIKAATSRSEVMQWGDTTYTDDKVSEFIGNLDLLSASASEDPAKNAVNARQIDLERLYSMYVTATTSADRLRIGQELQQELSTQMKVDLIHDRFLSLVYPDDEAKQDAMRTDKVKPGQMECELRVHNAFQAYAAEHFDANSGFALQYHQIVVNVCADYAEANGPISQLEGAVKDACSQGIVV
jgi:legumain